MRGRQHVVQYVFGCGEVNCARLMSFRMPGGPTDFPGQGRLNRRWSLRGVEKVRRRQPDKPLHAPSQRERARQIGSGVQ